MQSILKALPNSFGNVARKIRADKEKRLYDSTGDDALRKYVVGFYEKHPEKAKLVGNLQAAFGYPKQTHVSAITNFALDTGYVPGTSISTQLSLRQREYKNTRSALVRLSKKNWLDELF